MMLSQDHERSSIQAMEIKEGHLFSSYAIRTVLAHFAYC